MKSYVGDMPRVRVTLTTDLTNASTLEPVINITSGITTIINYQLDIIGGI